MKEYENQFIAIKDALNSKEPTNKKQVFPLRNVLEWFGASRRGAKITHKIRYELGKYELITEPDFEQANINGTVTFKKASSKTSSNNFNIDPSHKIERLDAANKKPISITRTEPLSKALTIMLLNDFSQLPVMQNERKVNGFISWKTIGEKLITTKSLDISQKTVSDFMSEDIIIVTKNETIFSVLTKIPQNDFVLIKDSTNNEEIIGIVTVNDLNEQFHLLSKPFLLISEIENGIRHILDKIDLSDEELKKAKKPDSSEEIESIADLNFGGYQTILGNSEIWKRLNLNLDRQEFIKTLDKIREIRNDVMHFDPDGLDKNSIELLEEFSHFLKSLRKCLIEK
ncbi:CBS domain-containing protein [Neisseria subflava]|uniref:CBS domain-containing protein n=1 Tax=Neisseria subflava TaxID=28449 RepID=UPI0027DF0111|nr:CBS domain-containing protein [Neisseria subflava]